MALNTQAILEKWKRNSTADPNALIRGADSVTESPTAKAARSKDKMLRKITEAVTSGRYEQACNAVTLGDWQQAFKTKGVRNYTAGVQGISQKAAKAMADQQQYAEAVKQEVAAMPTDTDAQAEEKCLAVIRKMRQYGRRV